MTHLRQRMQEDLRLRTFPNARFVATPRSLLSLQGTSTSHPISWARSTFARFCCICLMSASLHGERFRALDRR